MQRDFSFLIGQFPEADRTYSDGSRSTSADWALHDQNGLYESLTPGPNLIRAIHDVVQRLARPPVGCSEGLSAVASYLLAAIRISMNQLQVRAVQEHSHIGHHFHLLRERLRGEKFLIEEW